MDDHDLLPNQLFRGVIHGDSGHDLPFFLTKRYLQPQQLVGAGNRSQAVTCATRKSSCLN
jgi:hypothetical protein